MYKHILVPTDGSPLSLKAVKAATELAYTMKARVTALHVMPRFSPPMMEEAAAAYVNVYSEAEFRKSSEKHAAKVLAKAKGAFESRKIRCDTAAVTGASPWETIIAAAKGRKCDLIVMASHGRRGLAGVLLGSETTKVLTHSKTPVLVCR
jgi:nucleotide-binding universal stress UspA family protein